MNDAISSGLTLSVGYPMSTLEKVIVDWYDGPVEGAFRCKPSGKSYAFIMLAWDTKLDVRVFRLSSLPPGSFEKLDIILKQLLKHSSSKEEYQAKYDGMTTILRQASKTEYIIAWRMSDDILLVSKPVSASELYLIEQGASWESAEPNYDWFGSLNLIRE